MRALPTGERMNDEGRYVRLRVESLDHSPRVAPPVSVDAHGPRSLALAGRCADGTVLDSLSTSEYGRWARERIDAQGSHRLTVFAHCGEPAVVERLAGALPRAGEPQTERLGDGPGAAAPVDRENSFVLALRDAGADCVVLVPPDPAVALDAAALS